MGDAPLSLQIALTGGVASDTMAAVTFAGDLASAFDRRRANNRRYSLRAFARSIGISHSAAGRLLKGTQRPSDSTILLAAKHLGWHPARVADLMRAERRHRLEDAVSSSAFVANARWLASRTNLTLDDVQLALHDALRQRRIEMHTPQTWKVIN